MKPAIFLDRDGVLIEDIDLLTDVSQINVINSVPEALKQLKDAGFRLIVVSNQTVVARGLITEADVLSIHSELQEILTSAEAPNIDAWYFCPHHPEATLPEYRKDCDCRKPKPGMLFQAAQEFDIDLQASYMIGDRITDIIAGARANCRTILVHTGKHNSPPIITKEKLDLSTQPDHTCDNLLEASSWICNQL